MWSVVGAKAADSTITVTATVRDNTCTIQAGSTNFSVNLLQTATKQLIPSGGASPPVPFNITFSRCGAAAAAVRIGFTGSTDVSNSSLLKTDTGTNAAQGVAIQILTASQAPVAVNAAQSALPWISLQAGQPVTLQYWARMMSTGTPVVAGTVNATAGITLEFQ